jgi:uncharacterized protein YbcI
MHGDQPRATTVAQSEAAPTAAVSTAVVRVVADFLGRGPTKAKTWIVGDVVVVVLGDTHTRAEHRLIEEGSADVVEAFRRRVHSSMRDALVEAVEGVLDRRVVAVLGDHEADADVAAQVFVLAPEDGHPDGRA